MPSIKEIHQETIEKMLTSISYVSVELVTSFQVKAHRARAGGVFLLKSGAVVPVELLLAAGVGVLVMISHDHIESAV